MKAFPVYHTEFSPWPFFRMKFCWWLKVYETAAWGGVHGSWNVLDNVYNCCTEMGEAIRVFPIRHNLGIRHIQCNTATSENTVQPDVAAFQIRFIFSRVASNIFLKQTSDSLSTVLQLGFIVLIFSFFQYTCICKKTHTFSAAKYIETNKRQVNVIMAFNNWLNKRAWLFKI